MASAVREGSGPPYWNKTTIESGSSSADAVKPRSRDRGPVPRRANQTPGTPNPSMASETARNAKWYQRTTLRIRVIAIS